MNRYVFSYPAKVYFDEVSAGTIVRVISLGHAKSGAEAMAHEKGKVYLELV